MNGILAEQQWKGKLVAGALAAILGGVLLAWPGPSILVVSVLFGVYLLVSGFTEVYMAFTLPRSAPARVMWFIAGALSVVMAIFYLPALRRGLRRLTAVAVGRSRLHLPGRFRDCSCRKPTGVARPVLVHRYRRHIHDRRGRCGCLAV